MDVEGMIAGYTSAAILISVSSLVKSLLLSSMSPREHPPSQSCFSSSLHVYINVQEAESSIDWSDVDPGTSSTYTCQGLIQGVQGSVNSVEYKFPGIRGKKEPSPRPIDRLPARNSRTMDDRKLLIKQLAK